MENSIVNFRGIRIKILIVRIHLKIWGNQNENGGLEDSIQNRRDFRMKTSVEYSIIRFRAIRIKILVGRIYLQIWGIQDGNCGLEDFIPNWRDFRMKY